jgi:predicted TIM-barrel fold metal-dependent hydrolase
MLIDVNASFGGRESIQRFDLQTLASELDRTPLSLAFVGCNEGVFDQRTGNDRLFAACDAHPSWLPAASLHPRDTFVWRDEVDRCLAREVRLFRFAPAQSGWPVDSVLLDDLLARLEGAGAALLIDATPPGLPSRLTARAEGTGIPLIFTESRYFPLTELIPLARHYSDVFIDTSRLTSPGGIALCVRELGPDRLLYGSGACRYPAWVAWQQLERAVISDTDREAIAWRNAARLLNLDPPPPPAQSAAAAQTSCHPELVDGPPAAAARLRRPSQPSMEDQRETGQTQGSAATGEERLPGTAAFPEAIDVHLHDKFPGAPFPPFDAAVYARELARNRIVAGVSSSATAIFYDLRLGNDENERLLEAVPALRGYVVVDPRYLDDSLAELQRLERSERWVGVKIHCAHARTPTRAPAMEPLFEAIAAYGRPLLIHPLGEDWPEALCRHARCHLELPIIAAHAGYGDAPHPTHDAALRVADEPNIHIEFCSTYLATGAIRRGVEAVGVDRVLFGSDFPLISLEYMRIAYQEAELSPVEEARICRENALQLFPALDGPQAGRFGEGRKKEASAIAAPPLG